MQTQQRSTSSSSAIQFFRHLFPSEEDACIPVGDVPCRILPWPIQAEQWLQRRNACRQYMMTTQHGWESAPRRIMGSLPIWLSSSGGVSSYMMFSALKCMTFMALAIAPVPSISLPVLIEPVEGKFRDPNTRCVMACFEPQEENYANDNSKPSGSYFTLILVLQGESARVSESSTSNNHHPAKTLVGKPSVPPAGIISSTPCSLFHNLDDLWAKHVVMSGEVKRQYFGLASWKVAICPQVGFELTLEQLTQCDTRRPSFLPPAKTNLHLWCRRLARLSTPQCMKICYNYLFPEVGRMVHPVPSSVTPTTLLTDKRLINHIVNEIDEMWQAKLKPLNQMEAPLFGFQGDVGCNPTHLLQLMDVMLFFSVQRVEVNASSLQCILVLSRKGHDNDESGVFCVSTDLPTLMMLRNDIVPLLLSAKQLS